jgi:hypothetical protein
MLTVLRDNYFMLPWLHLKHLLVLVHYLNIFRFPVFRFNPDFYLLIILDSSVSSVFTLLNFLRFLIVFCGW